jgi:hypothetical protein
MEFDSGGGQGFDEGASSDGEAPVTVAPPSDLLQRIADTIGVTVAMFGADTPIRAARSPSTTAEVHAMLDAFLALHEPETRARGLSLGSVNLAGRR